MKSKQQKIQKKVSKKTRNTGHNMYLQSGGLNVTITNSHNGQTIHISDTNPHTSIHRIKDIIMTRMGFSIEDRFSMVIMSDGRECLDWFYLGDISDAASINLSISIQRLSAQEQIDKVKKLLDLDSCRDILSRSYFFKDRTDELIKGQIIHSKLDDLYIQKLQLQVKIEKISKSPGNMQIYVRSVSSAISLMMKPTDTISDVKRELLLHWPINPLHHALFFNGRQASDDQTLASMNLVSGSTLNTASRHGYGRIIDILMKYNGEISDEALPDLFSRDVITLQNEIIELTHRLSALTQRAEPVRGSSASTAEPARGLIPPRSNPVAYSSPPEDYKCLICEPPQQTAVFAAEPCGHRFICERHIVYCATIKQCMVCNRHVNGFRRS